LRDGKPPVSPGVLYLQQHFINLDNVALNNQKHEKRLHWQAAEIAEAKAQARLVKTPAEDAQETNMLRPGSGTQVQIQCPIPTPACSPPPTRPLQTSDCEWAPHSHNCDLTCFSPGPNQSYGSLPSSHYFSPHSHSHFGPHAHSHSCSHPHSRACACSPLPDSHLPPDCHHPPCYRGRIGSSDDCQIKFLFSQCVLEWRLYFCYYQWVSSL
jgi:hypothetical protein